jgi:type VI secretion system protein ImpH
VHQSLAFPPSEVQALKPSADPDAPPEMTVAFMGLTGPTGVLPHAYTDLLIDRARMGDRTAAGFLDLLNHRLISLFFRAWEKYRPYLAHERGEGDRASRHLFDLIGLGLEPLRNRNTFPDDALRFYSGFFARRHRPAIVLVRLLKEYFGLPIEVVQFVGQWLPLEPADRSRLGASGAHNGLGTTLVLGSRVWDEQGKFRIRVGPLTFAQFLAFSPDGADFRSLVQMTRMYADAEFTFDVQLILMAEEVPACHLGPKSPSGPRLGRTAWLKSRPMVKDAEDAVFPAGV